MYQNKSLLRAMSSYFSKEVGEAVTVVEYSEVNRVLCESGCWEEIRVEVTGVYNKTQKLFFSEYEGEMSEFIVELEKHSYLTAWGDDEHDVMTDIKNFVSERASMPSQVFRPYFPAKDAWPGGYIYNETFQEEIRPREFPMTDAEKIAAFDRGETKKAPELWVCHIMYWEDINGKKYGKLDWVRKAS